MLLLLNTFCVLHSAFSILAAPIAPSAPPTHWLSVPAGHHPSLESQVRASSSRL